MMGLLWTVMVLVLVLVVVVHSTRGTESLDTTTQMEEKDLDGREEASNLGRSEEEMEEMARDGTRIKFESGSYFICSKGSYFHQKRCLTYLPTLSPLSSPFASRGEGNPGNHSHNRLGDRSVMEHPLYRRVYSSEDYGSTFTLSYPDPNSTHFTLSCHECANDFHGPDIIMVKNHLEFRKRTEEGETNTPPPSRFTAMRSGKTDSNLVKIKAEDRTVFCKWLTIDAFKKHITLRIRPLAASWNLYRTLRDDDPVTPLIY